MVPEPEDIDINNEKKPRPFDEDDIALLKTYGLGPYSNIKRSSFDRNCQNVLTHYHQTRKLGIQLENRILFPSIFKACINLQTFKEGTSLRTSMTKRGVAETIVLNMSKLVWSVVTSVQGRVPLASEGLSLIVSSYNVEDILVSFGGYNGRYSNEVNVLKPSPRSTLQSNMMERPVPDSVVALHDATNATKDVESEFEGGQEGRIREILMDNVDSKLKSVCKLERNLFRKVDWLNKFIAEMWPYLDKVNVCSSSMDSMTV